MRVKIFPADATDAVLRAWGESKPTKVIVRTERVVLDGQAQPSLLVFYEEEHTLSGGHELSGLDGPPAAGERSA